MKTSRRSEAREDFWRGVGHHPLAGGREGDQIEDHDECAENAHRDRPAAGAVAMAELVDERQGQGLDDELPNQGGDEAVARDAGALADVRGHDPHQRRVRRVVRRVEDHHQRIGQVGVDQLPLHPEGRGAIHQPEHQAEGQGGPEDPGPELAPAAVGAVRRRADDRVDHRVNEGAGRGTSSRPPPPRAPPYPCRNGFGRGSSTGRRNWSRCRRSCSRAFPGWIA